MTITEGRTQGLDGDAHLTYYDKDSDQSFVYDGMSNKISVSKYGYGEPPSDEIEATALDTTTTDMVIEAFERICSEYIVSHRGQPA